MTTENQAVEAQAETVTKMDPTLNSIRQEREEAAAERARIEAERAERARVQEKRALIGQVLNMQEDIEKRFEAVKAQKKLLKGLKLDLEAIADDEDLDADDLRELIKRGHEAYNVGGEDAFAAVGAIAAVLAGALGAPHRGGPVRPSREMFMSL